MVCRLARRKRPPPNESLRHQKSGHHLPGQNEAAGRSKKSPAHGTLAGEVRAWAEALARSEARTTAEQLIAAAGPVPIHLLNNVHVAGLLATWRKSYAPCTLYHRARLLRRLLRALGRPDLCSTMPRVRNPGPRQVLVTPQEITNLLEKAKPWFRMELLLCIHTAIRSGDARTIAEVHYNKEKRTIRWKQQKTERIHELPVSEEIAAMFEAAPKIGDEWTPYVERYRGRAVPRCAIDHEWKRMRKLAAIRPEVTMHDLRRTTATALYNLTKDLRAVQQLLGHRWLGSSAYYVAGSDPERLAPLLAQLRMTTEVPQ